MGWMRVRNDIGNHPKHIQVSPSASFLWVCGIGYCREKLTDGFIPRQAIVTLGNFGKGQALAAELVAVGLWHVDGNGYRVNDYAQMNASKSEVLEKREQEAERLRQARASKRTPDTPYERSTSVRSSERTKADLSHYVSTSDQEGSSGEIDDGAGARLYAAWREALKPRGVVLPVMPKAAEILQLVEVCARVPDEAKRFEALRRFVGLSDAERLKRGIKALTLGYLVMALPDLVDAPPATAPASCKNRHTPPCRDEAACTRRFLAEERAEREGLAQA